MWKKNLTRGIILGVVSFILFCCCRLANNYGVVVDGLDLKATETLGAFGIAISLGIIAIAIFSRRLPQK